MTPLTALPKSLEAIAKDISFAYTPTNVILAFLNAALEGGMAYKAHYMSGEVIIIRMEE